MRKKIRLGLIIVCILVLAGIRVFSPEDTRICDWNTLVKHGNPSIDGSGFFSFGRKSQDITCSWGKILPLPPLASQHIPMKIITDFTDKGSMPSQYTCDWAGYFPILKVENLPADTKSLALIIDDPDAPSGVRDHLLLANIPLTWDSSISLSQDSFDQWVLGRNGRWEQAWWAPCPPSGTHRYVFKLYALSSMLEISSGFSKERLEELMWGKILEQTQIIGLYKRN